MIKRNLIANYLGQGYAAFTAVAILPLYIRYLGIEAYGLIGVFTIAYALLGVVDSMLQTVITREMAQITASAEGNTDKAPIVLFTAEITLFTLAVIITAAFWGLSEFLAVHWVRAEKLPTQTVSCSLAWMGVVVASRLFEGLYRACLLGFQRHVVYNALQVIITTARWGGALVVVAFISPTITAFFAWQASSGMLASILLRVATHAYLPKHEDSSPYFSFAVLSQGTRFVSGVFAISFLALLLTQLDKVILSKMLPLSEFGYYTLANTLSVGLALVVFPIADTCYPRMSEALAQKDYSSVSHVFHLGAQLVSVTVGSLTITMIIFAESVLMLWTQNPSISTKTAPILRLLLLGQLLNALYWIPYRAQLAHGWTELAVRINLMAVLLLVPAIVLTVPLYGATGAAIIWVCLNVGYLSVGVTQMFKRILRDERRKWYWTDTAKPLFFNTICALIISFFHHGSASQLENLLIIAIAWSGGLCAAALAASYLKIHIYSLINDFFSHSKYR